jgi:hypothetical protein
MPGRNDAITAARFELTIDGHEVGRFEALFAAAVPGAALRALHVHDLQQRWQHAGEFQPGKFAQTDYHFDLPSARTQPGGRPPSTIVLRRGVGRGASYWRTLRHGSVTLVALGAAGQPVAHYRLSHAWVVKFTAPTFDAKGGGDVAIEEIVIGYEGVCLVPGGGCRSRVVSKP